jgi:hypothetical protein
MIRIAKVKTQKYKKHKKFNQQKKSRKSKKYKKFNQQKGNGIDNKNPKKTYKNKVKSKYNVQQSQVVTHQQLMMNHPPPRQVISINISDVELRNEIVANCQNTNECLTLGIYGDYVKEYFNNFNDLTMIDENNISVIASGNNGVVCKIPFKKNGLVSYTILKYPVNDMDIMSADIHPDNLFYEYYVGKHFINNYNTIFPCFLETYNCYTGNIGNMNIHSYFLSKKRAPNNSWSLFNWFGFRGKPKDPDESHFYELEPFNVDIGTMWSDACRFSKSICIISQYFDNLTEMLELLSELSSDEIICCLYQVYFPLSLLGTNYTHYDLHSSNVLRYSLDSYIKMHYHIDDENEVVFYTNNIFKIIDYGRNYFNDGNINSRDLIQQVCDEPICNQTSEISADRLCGDTRGFSYIKGSIKGKAHMTYFISPNEHNVSHDLRFANEIRKNRPDVFALIADDITFVHERGTPEILRNTFTPTNRVISNIFDMRNALDLYLSSNPPYQQQQPQPQQPITAELHVYSDGRNYTYNKY